MNLKPKTYKDPYFPVKSLVKAKRKTLLEPGFVFAPYVPLHISELLPSGYEEWRRYADLAGLELE